MKHYKAPLREGPNECHGAWSIRDIHVTAKDTWYTWCPIRHDWLKLYVVLNNWIRAFLSHLLQPCAIYLSFTYYCYFYITHSPESTFISTLSGTLECDHPSNLTTLLIGPLFGRPVWERSLMSRIYSRRELRPPPPNTSRDPQWWP